MRGVRAPGARSSQITHTLHPYITFALRVGRPVPRLAALTTQATRARTSIGSSARRTEPRGRELSRARAARASLLALSVTSLVATRQLVGVAAGHESEL